MHPVLKLFKQALDDSWVEVHDTKEVKGTANPKWQKVVVSTQHFCNSDMNRPIKATINSRTSTSENYVAEARPFTLQEVINLKNESIKLVNK